ncbi:AIPR family protein [Neobacillus drentensis]|uniref:AIPR family protein n=1 Tax=Neobacillus drentensis TaxID=220684 RepID=UPI002FFDF4A3
MRDINVYYQDLNEDINRQCEISGEDKKQVFTTLISDHLIENESIIAPNICSFQSPADGICINGYELSDEMNTLHVFITDYVERGYPVMISSEEIAILIGQAEMFVYAAITGQLDIISINREAHPEIYDLANTISSNHKNIRHASIHVMTNRISEVEECLPQSVIEATSLSYHIWDLQKLYDFDVEEKRMDELNIKLVEQFNEQLRLIKVPVEDDTYDCYIGYVPGTLLAKAYEYYGNRLMERNVRSYLQARGKINKGIIATAKKNPTMFMAYNNGLTTIAEEVVFSNQEESGFVEISELIGWQIVNGGQTTASLYRALVNGEDLSKVHVQIKLNVIKDMTQRDDLISKISEYANSQNKISISDLRSNDSFQAELERLSYMVSIPGTTDPETKWFYERTRGQYNVEVNRHGTTSAKKRAYQKEFPKTQLITKTETAKYIMSWEQFPYIVSKGSEANFLEFCEIIREQKVMPTEKYFRHMIAKGILFRETDKLVQSLGYKGYKANLVTYSIALLSLLKKQTVDLDFIWNKQKLNEHIVKELKELIPVIWKHITNPPVAGTNVTQYCKKEICWTSLKEKVSKGELAVSL